MKNTVKLSAIVLSVAGLASCSTLGLDQNDSSSNQDQHTVVVSTDKATTDSKEASAPTSEITIKKNSDDQIVANITTDYNGNPQGSVRLQWQAPEGSKCYDTNFPITKYGETNDKTHASVEVKQGSSYCSGTWTANVLYDNNVIASDSVTV